MYDKICAKKIISNTVIKKTPLIAKKRENAKMHRYICIILLLNCAVFSNECVIIFGRNEEVVNVQTTNISMREEEIIITLHKDYYEVDVTFVFFNSGSTENLQLGFPIQGSHYKFGDDKVYDFKTIINGKIIPTYITKTDAVDKSDSSGIHKYLKWFIRDAIFPMNSCTKSRVTYKAQYSDCGGISVAGYIYGTGRFWKDGIGKMTVIINHGDGVLIDKIDFGDLIENKQNFTTDPSEFIWEANGKYKYIFKKVKPQSTQERISIFIQPFDIYGKYNDEFGVLPLNMKGSHIDNYHYNYWWAWSEHLLYKNSTDIQHYTQNQIRLFINFFFAHHGYDFKNSIYKEFFGRIENFGDKNQTKYKVNPKFKESDFNEIEKKNVNYLLNLEKMISK